MALFALTRLSSQIVTISFLVAVGLIIYNSIPRLYPRKNPLTLSWPVLLIRGLLECVSLFLWLAVGLPLLAWAFWIGDNDHWFYHYAWIFAAVIAVGTSMLMIRRFRHGTASLCYARTHFWIPLLLLTSFGAAWFSEFIQPIEATTAEAAAHKVMARLAPYIDEPVHLVEDTDTVSHGLDATCYKRYWIMGVNEPRGRFTISRYERFWWACAGYTRFPPSKSELDRAIQWMKESNRDGAIRILKSVVENYPNTPSGEEAKTLLQSLE